MSHGTDNVGEVEVVNAADVVEAASSSSLDSAVAVPDKAAPVAAGAVAILPESPVPVVAGVANPIKVCITWPTVTGATTETTAAGGATGATRAAT